MMSQIPVMLILRGIAGHYDGKDWPRGALYEAPALAYAKMRGYEGRVLDVSGEAYEGAPQVVSALAEFRCDARVQAFYGFSGGGYNLRHILAELNDDERDRIRLVIALGAPNKLATPSSVYRTGRWEVIYREDPPEGHMHGPQSLLDLGFTQGWDVS